MPANKSQPRNLRRKSQEFEKKKRGSQDDLAVKKKEDESPVSPLVLAIFLFVVLGSALLQIFRGF